MSRCELLIPTAAGLKKAPEHTSITHARCSFLWVHSAQQYLDKDPLIHPRVPSPVWTRSFNLEHRLKLVFFLEAPYRIISVAINGQYDCHTIFTVWTSIRISPLIHLYVSSTECLEFRSCSGYPTSVTSYSHPKQPWYLIHDYPFPAPALTWFINL